MKTEDTGRENKRKLGRKDLHNLPKIERKETREYKYLTKLGGLLLLNRKRKSITFQSKR
jgi:hypothetical protein